MPTKEQFEAYVKVQRSGKYNMIMDWRAAAKEAGLDSMTYMIIISYYSDLKKLYAESSCSHFASYCAHA